VFNEFAKGFWLVDFCFLMNVSYSFKCFFSDFFLDMTFFHYPASPRKQKKNLRFIGGLSSTGAEGFEPSAYGFGDRMD